MIDLSSIVGQKEGLRLDYQAVLPPSRTLARTISAFANAEGGVIILGVSEEANGSILPIGLSDDFRASQVLNRSLELLMPSPDVRHAYQMFEGVNLYVIEVERSQEIVMLGEKQFVRDNSNNIELNALPDNASSLPELTVLRSRLRGSVTMSGSMSKFVEHYISVLNIIADLRSILYPVNHMTPTDNTEGKILMRILFSSCADNFETYLSDLLYEIYLARPETLKGPQQVTVKEVLDCSDIQEFIEYIAKKRLSKLQRGSVKGFISENKEISSLSALSDQEQENIEKIMQIRHLYAHRNGVVDEKFSQHFPGQFAINDIHTLSVESFLKHFEYLLAAVAKVDTEALRKYRLATV